MKAKSHQKEAKSNGKHSKGKHSKGEKADDKEGTEASTGSKKVQKRDADSGSSENSESDESLGFVQLNAAGTHQTGNHTHHLKGNHTLTGAGKGGKGGKGGKAGKGGKGGKPRHGGHKQTTVSAATLSA